MGEPAFTFSVSVYPGVYHGKRFMKDLRNLKSGYPKYVITQIEPN